MKDRRRRLVGAEPYVRPTGAEHDVADSGDARLVSAEVEKGWARGFRARPRSLPTRAASCPPISCVPAAPTGRRGEELQSCHLSTLDRKRCPTPLPRQTPLPRHPLPARHPSLIAVGRSLHRNTREAESGAVGGDESSP